MKKLILLFIISTFTTNFSIAQKTRASPKETTNGKINQSDVTITYGAPYVKGRVIWGELVPFDKIWRAGANEATTFEFSKDVDIENQKLPAGKYSFFLIPNKEKCTIIFNNDFKQWGAYKYDIDKDQLRLDVKPLISSDQVEKLVYEIDQNNILIKWSNWVIKFDVKSD
ncbi:MAG: DUF2911 domain-containing protein [Parvicellaceae bacterium]